MNCKCITAMGFSLLSAMVASTSSSAFAAPMHGAGHGKANAHVHWTYEGKDGPGAWGSLSQDFSACSEGKHQSPINVSEAIGEDLPDIKFTYSATTPKVLHNGHTVQFNVAGAGEIELAGKKFILKQFHFHTPSEHMVEGKKTPLEMHLVHQSDDGKLAVVGVMIEANAENSVFAKLWKFMPNKESAEAPTTVSINPIELLPKDPRYYTYAGSLTTPPCSEGVTWLLMRKTGSASAEQIEALHKVMGTNNRPVQPVHDRRLTKDIAAHM